MLFTHSSATALPLTETRSRIGTTAEQTEADEFLKNMQRTRKWESPQWKRLFGGLGELRWIAEKKQHRLMGFFDGDIFVALIGCTHKDKRYKPDNALNTANDRHAKLKSGQGVRCKYDL